MLSKTSGSSSVEIQNRDINLVFIFDAVEVGVAWLGTTRSFLSTTPFVFSITLSLIILPMSEVLCLMKKQTKRKKD
jgi:hypothetical protein